MFRPILNIMFYSILFYIILWLLWIYGDKFRTSVQRSLLLWNTSTSRTALSPFRLQMPCVLNVKPTLSTVSYRRWELDTVSASRMVLIPHGVT